MQQFCCPYKLWKTAGLMFWGNINNESKPSVLYRQSECVGSTFATGKMQLLLCQPRVQNCNTDPRSGHGCWTPPSLLETFGKPTISWFHCECLLSDYLQSSLTTQVQTLIPEESICSLYLSILRRAHLAGPLFAISRLIPWLLLFPTHLLLPQTGLQWLIFTSLSNGRLSKGKWNTRRLYPLVCLFITLKSSDTFRNGSFLQKPGSHILWYIIKDSTNLSNLKATVSKI